MNGDCGSLLYFCQVCRKKLFKNHGFSCFSCCFPAVRLCKWLKESVHQKREAEFVLTLDSRYWTWVGLGYYFSSSFQNFQNFQDSKIAPDADTNTSKTMDFYMAPYVVDSSFEILVSRMLNTPSPLRAWAITIKAERPISFFLDLEAQESKWPKLLFSKSPEQADFQMFTTLKWVANFIHEKFDVVSKIKRCHWWIFSCDRQEECEQEGGSSDKNSKERKQSFQLLGVKRSRRCYLPSLEFKCIGNLHKFMQEMKRRILKVIQGPESCEKTKVSVFAGFKNGEFLSYIDFGVYHGERQMRVPLCVKRHPHSFQQKKQDTLHPLSLFQVGESEWCEELFFKNKNVLFSTSRKKEVREFLLYLQTSSKEKQKSKEKEKEKEKEKICPAFLQIAAGMIYYGPGGIRNQEPDAFLTFAAQEEDQNQSQSLATGDSIHGKKLWSIPSSFPSQNIEPPNEENYNLSVENTKKRKRKRPPLPISSSSFLEQKRDKKENEKAELFYPKIPSQLLEVALAWLRGEGNDDCSSVTPFRNAKGQTILSIRAPQKRARTCYFLVSNIEKEKQEVKTKTKTNNERDRERQAHRNNGAFFTIHFGNRNFNFEGPDRTIVTKGYFHYRCLSQSCVGKKSPMIRWILPYSWNLEPKPVILIS